MDNEFKIIIPDRTLRQLKTALTAMRLSGRSASLPEIFIQKVLDLIKEGKKEHTFITKENKGNKNG